MGLLKSIKYSMFEVSVLNGIVDGMIERMNILGVDFMSFISRVLKRTRMTDDRIPRDLIGK